MSNPHNSKYVSSNIIIVPTVSFCETSPPKKQKLNANQEPRGQTIPVIPVNTNSVPLVPMENISVPIFAGENGPNNEPVQVKQCLNITQDTRRECEQRIMKTLSWASNYLQSIGQSQSKVTQLTNSAVQKKYAKVDEEITSKNVSKTTFKYDDVAKPPKNLPSLSNVARTTTPIKYNSIATGNNDHEIKDPIEMNFSDHKRSTDQDSEKVKAHHTKNKLDSSNFENTADSIKTPLRLKFPSSHSKTHGKHNPYEEKYDRNSSLTNVERNSAVKKDNCISITQSKIRDNINYSKEKHDKDIPKNTKSMRDASSLHKRSTDRNADRKKDFKESKPSTSKNENPYKWYGVHIKNGTETSSRTENRSEKRAHTYRNSGSPFRSRSELRKEKDKYNSANNTVKSDRNYDNSKEKMNPTKNPNDDEHIAANTKPLTKSNQKYVNKTSEMSNTAVKSVIQVKNNYDLNSFKNVHYHGNNVEDLRSKLKRKHENNKRDNLIITVPNNEKEDTSKPVIPEESPKLQKKSRKYKKIKLIINVICENGSESSESDNDTKNKDNCREVNEDIISFLDDFNVDDIVDSLNDQENKVNVKNPSEEDFLENTKNDTVKESTIDEQDLKAKDCLNMHKRFHTKSPQVKLELKVNRNTQEIEDNNVNDKKYRSLELTENQNSNKIHVSDKFPNKNKVDLIEIKSGISDTNSSKDTWSFKCGQNVTDPNITVKVPPPCSTQTDNNQTKHNIAKPVSSPNKETNLNKNEKSWTKLDSSPTETVIRSAETENNAIKQVASKNSTKIDNDYKLDTHSTKHNTSQTNIDYYPTKLDTDRIKLVTNSSKLIPIHNKLENSKTKVDNYMTKQSTDVNNLGSSRNSNLSNLPGRHNIFSAIDAIVSSNETKLDSNSAKVDIIPKKLGCSQSKVDKKINERNNSIINLDTFSTKVATNQSKRDSKSTELIASNEQDPGLNKLNSNITKIDNPKSKLDNNRTKVVSSSTEAGNELITTNVVLDDISTQINIIKNTQDMSSKLGRQPIEQGTSQTKLEYGANKVNTNLNEQNTTSTKLGTNQNKLESNLTELDIIPNKSDTFTSELNSNQVTFGTSPNKLDTDSTELDTYIDINKYDTTPNKLTSQAELNTILKVDTTKFSTIPINKTTSKVTNITMISDKGKKFENETKEVVTIDLTVVESEKEPLVVQTQLTQPKSEKQHTIAKSVNDDIIDLTLSPKTSEVENVERSTIEPLVPMYKYDENSSNHHKDTKSYEDTSEMINNAENLSIEIDIVSKEHENKETIAEKKSININDVISIEDGSKMGNRNSLINTDIICKEHENNESIATENSFDVDLSTETEEVSNNIIPTPNEQHIETNQKLAKTEETLSTKYLPELQHQEAFNNSQNNKEISNITYEKESNRNKITEQTTEISQGYVHVHETKEKLEINEALHLACEQVNNTTGKNTNNSGTKGTDLSASENDVVSLNDENLTSYNSETSDSDKTPSAGIPECVKLKMVTNKNDAPVKLMEIVPEVKTTIIKQDIVDNDKNNSESTKQQQTAVIKSHLRGSELISALEFRLTKNLKTKITIESLINHGRFSKVYRCKAENGRNYALKVLNKGKKMTGCPIEQMLKTIQADIPKKNYHIIFLVDGFAMWEHSCYLMDFFPRNIKEVMIERNKCFHIDVVQMLTRQLVSAVLILRNQNILHLDIKPSHILINANNDRVKLAGFDQAQYLEGHTVLPGVGTANYRAPEVILGFPYFGKVDVWSTALVIYEMCTNSQLFPGRYNNDILFKQMCIFGNIPNDMLVQCVFTNKHYRGPFFARRYGPAWKQCQLIQRFKKSNRLSSSLFEAYYRDWGQSLSRRKRSDDSSKLHILRDLLQAMLDLNPTTRMPVEFVYTNSFIYETFNYDLY